ncbi:phospholipid phosphatase 5-like [Glandiceps talaboti]
MFLKCDLNQMAISITSEFIVRLVLLIVFLITEEMEPFHRVIQPEEMWLYKNPRSADTVSTFTVFSIAIFVPLVVIVIVSILRRDKVDAFQAILAVSLALCLNGIITNSVKLTVGRPRPDFFWRCFPNGKSTPDLKCTGDPTTITEGRKSFPSGHSSFSFTGLGFTALFLASKLHCFNCKGRGMSWRLCVAMLPLWCATMIAISRTEDYRHHWQDVLVGSILGLAICYLSYRQYYPALDKANCHKSHLASMTSDSSDSITYEMQELNAVVSEKGEGQPVKYI